MFLRRNLVPVVVTAVSLLGVACMETTPTEVPAFVSPTPAPTPIPQAASTSGKVTTYGGYE